MRGLRIKIIRASFKLSSKEIKLLKTITKILNLMKLWVKLVICAKEIKTIKILLIKSIFMIREQKMRED